MASAGSSPVEISSEFREGGREPSAAHQAFDEGQGVVGGGSVSVGGGGFGEAVVGLVEGFDDPGDGLVDAFSRFAEGGEGAEDFGAFGGVADHHHGAFDDRDLFLHSSRVGDGQGALGEEGQEIRVGEGIDHPDAVEDRAESEGGGASAAAGMEGSTTGRGKPARSVRMVSQVSGSSTFSGRWKVERMKPLGSRPCRARHRRAGREGGGAS